MSYTLATWAIWLILAAAIGGVVGWLLRGLRGESDTDTALDAESSAPASPPVDEAEVARLRAHILHLEQREIAFEQLRIDLDENRRALAAVAASAPVGAAALAAERDRLAAAVAELEATVGDLRARLWNQEARIAELQMLVAAQSMASAPPEPDLQAAAEVLGDTILLDDLTVIEGIGPKIAAVLRSAGITTWWQLHHADLPRLHSLLEAAGPRFQVHDPSTWPQQAGMLARGQWDEFRELTDALKGGRVG